MESKKQFFVAGSITMRSTIFAPLFMAAGSISGIAAEGIHCGGSTHCKTIVNTKLPTYHDLIDKFYEALGNGASDIVTGGPLIAYALYPSESNQYIAVWNLPVFARQLSQGRREWHSHCDKGWRVEQAWLLALRQCSSLRGQQPERNGDSHCRLCERRAL